MRASLFSSIAHELRTPLNSIIPILKMIFESLPITDIDRLLKYLRLILNSAYHLQNVIEDALDMSRLENGKF
jgi:signal transduction histidine kinase